MVWEFYWDSDAIGRTGSNTKSKSGRETGWTGSKDDLWHRIGCYVADSAFTTGIQGDIRAIGDSIGHRNCCRCFNSLEMKQRSEYNYPATAPSEGPAMFHPSFTSLAIYSTSPANKGAQDLRSSLILPCGQLTDFHGFHLLQKFTQKLMFVNTILECTDIRTGLPSTILTP